MMLNDPYPTTTDNCAESLLKRDAHIDLLRQFWKHSKDKCIQNHVNSCECNPDIPRTIIVSNESNTIDNVNVDQLQSSEVGAEEKPINWTHLLKSIVGLEYHQISKLMFLTVLLIYNLQ